ncbi:MAG: hypothetical protein Q8N13_10975 [Acidovorax sp.]|nr:hypothetical protein [Acidovorax sp.]
MNAALTPTVVVPDTIGAPFEGGFYGGKIRIAEAVFAVCWAPKALGEVQGAWLDRFESVPNAASCFDSEANTKAMAVAGSELANKVLALEIGGVKGWSVPARDVLELAYRHLKPTTEENSGSFRDGDNPSSIPAGYPYTDTLPAQTTVTAFQEGGAECFEEEWYWSSTQYSGSRAWLQTFSYGSHYTTSKVAEGRCRAVRLIQLST